MPLGAEATEPAPVAGGPRAPTADRPLVPGAPCSTGGSDSPLLDVACWARSGEKLWYSLRQLVDWARADTVLSNTAACAAGYIAMICRDFQCARLHVHFVQGMELLAERVP